MTVQRPVLDAMLILQREDGKVLLAERQGTGYADGQFNVPSGKAEEGEDILTAVIREAWEEIRIKLDPAELRTVHVMHHRNPEGGTRLGWFVRALRWDGDPVNAEPHKCAGLLWADPAHLPTNTVPYIAAGLAAYTAGIPHSVHGW